MEENSIKSSNWQEGVAWESTIEPGISVSAMVEEEPALTVTAIVGVVLVVLIAIVAVFILGVLIDCRQQRLLERRLGEVKRPKTQRRVSTHPDGDATSIVNNMEEPATSDPPADAVGNVTITIDRT